MSFKVVLYQLPLLSVLIFSSGCDRHAQYAVLTTIFTGVPPMEELYGNGNPEEKLNKVDSLEKSTKRVYQHPLWASRQCTACHQADTVEKLKMAAAGSREQQESDLAEQGVASTLIMPANKLCINCHIDKTSRRAIRERLWLHNPVARGDCLSCHAEHQSLTLAHLRQPLKNICSPCHDSNQLPLECIEERDDEPTENKCLRCHNTHMGRNRFLLTMDYRETKILIKAPTLNQ